MSSFDSTKQSLGKVLDSIVEGKIQLPDFQRGWVWDDTAMSSAPWAKTPSLTRPKP